MKDNKKASGKNGVSFSEVQLHRALLDIEDLLGRALVPFLLLNETARAVFDEKPLKGNIVVVGIEKKHLTNEAISTLRVYLKDKLPDPVSTFRYEVGGVPVLVKIINRKYRFFKNKDFKFYSASQYQLANPFEDYWKSRGLVR